MITNASGIVRKLRSTNAHGESVLEAVGKQERLGVVTLKVASVPTGIRAAESATRGNAREHISTVKLLLLPDTVAAEGDQIEVYAKKVRIVSMEPRFRAHGGLDHYEVTGERWV